MVSAICLRVRSSSWCPPSVSVSAHCHGVRHLSPCPLIVMVSAICLRVRSLSWCPPSVSVSAIYPCVRRLTLSGRLLSYFMYLQHQCYNILPFISFLMNNIFYYSLKIFTMVHGQQGTHSIHYAQSPNYYGPVSSPSNCGPANVAQSQ